MARSRARSPWHSVSFWELFLCAYLLKEKVYIGKEVAKVSGTNHKYQNPLAAFLCHKRHKEKLTKEMPIFCANAARAPLLVESPLLRKAGQNNHWVCANIVLDKSKFEI